MYTGASLAKNKDGFLWPPVLIAASGNDASKYHKYRIRYNRYSSHLWLMKVVFSDGQLLSNPIGEMASRDETKYSSSEGGEVYKANTSRVEVVKRGTEDS